MEQLITTIAPAWESFRINDSGPTGEIGTQLRTILGSGRVLDRAIDRIAFSSDASFYSLVPQAIAQPATLEEIGALFRLSRAQNIALVFRAGGTSLSGQGDYGRRARRYLALLAYVRGAGRWTRNSGATGCHWPSCERQSQTVRSKDWA